MATTTAATKKATATLPTDIDAAALQIGANVTNAQSNLMKAYSLKDGASATELSKLAKDLGVTFKDSKELNVKTLQLVAEQRFQQQSSVASLFTNLMEKLQQMKQQIINNLRN